MTRNDFFDVLKKELKDIESEEKKELLADFAEHFEMASAEGKSEEDICAQLGDPLMIARQFKVDCIIAKAQGEVTSSNILQAVAAALGLGFINFFFVLTPFLALISVLFFAYFMVLLFVVVGLIVVFAAFAALFTAIEGLYSVFEYVSLAFFGIALTAFCVYLFLLLNRLSMWFFDLALKYMRFNLEIISGRKNLK